MTPVRSGIAFTLIMLIFLGVSFLVSISAWNGGSVSLSLFQNIILSEAIVLLPGLIIATVSGSEVGEIFRELLPAAAFESQLASGGFAE